MSETTPSPTLTQSLSSTTFATAPIVALLKKPLHLMSQDEMRAYAKEVRTLATSPQALGKMLREGAAERVVKAKSVEVKGGKSLEDLMKELGA